ncbi:MAG: FAD-dependent oxidoreductase [Chloroherpetonaceae bacterium]|nr:FAD-dependent oxidoreductase [Chthonomonadaceae bacterium]MDW8206843.1 FAD-dependent oxidoreductase [Chloroherpetonaceae bacterium]
MAQEHTVLIIGGGIIGLCTARYLRQDGHRVVLVERGAPDHDACSCGNAGMVVPSHFVPLAAPGIPAYALRMMLRPDSPFGLRLRPRPDLFRWGMAFLKASRHNHVARAAPLLRDLSLRSRQLYIELAQQEGNAFGLTRKGLLTLCRTEHALRHERELATQAQQLGLDAEVLSPEEVARLEPGLHTRVAGAVLFPQDCHLQPEALVTTLTRRLQACGVTFLWSTEVTGWQTVRDRVQAIRTSQGLLEADAFVLAGGVWSAQHNAALGLHLLLQAGKGYSLTLPHPPQRPERCVILTEARVAVTPMGQSLRFGGTMEIAGLDASVNTRRVQGLIRSIPRYFPAFTPEHFQHIPTWTGLRPCSPDGLPYIGRTRRYANLYVATGHAMLGVSLAPVTGQILADLLADRPPCCDLTLLSPDRFA